MDVFKNSRGEYLLTEHYKETGLYDSWFEDGTLYQTNVIDNVRGYNGKTYDNVKSAVYQLNKYKKRGF